MTPDSTFPHELTYIWCIINYQNNAYQVFRNAFLWKLDPHPPPRNANNIEPYTFVTLFSVKSDTPPPHPHLRYVTLEGPLTLLLAYTHTFTYTHICAQICYKRHFFRWSANKKIWHLEAIRRAALRIASFLNLELGLRARNIVKLKLMDEAVAEWLREWDTLTMFEATVYGRW